MPCCDAYALCPASVAECFDVQLVELSGLSKSSLQGTVSPFKRKEKKKKEKKDDQHKLESMFFVVFIF